MPSLSRYLLAPGVLATGVLATFLFLRVPPVSAEEERNLSALFRGSVGSPLPNASLPKHVPAPQGQLSFFADFGAADGGGVPLFLVNRTTAPIGFSSQDHDLYMKLEVRREDGIWERAQSHIGSWCGNSYYPIALPPGQFLRFRGYIASHGEKGRVRFSCYGSAHLLSNEGEGLVAPEDLEKARTDHMSLRSIPSSIVSLLSQEKTFAPQGNATLSTKVAALRLLQSYADNARLKQDSQRLADQLASSLTPKPEDQQAVAAIRAILAAPWPKQPSPDALFHRCARAWESRTAPALAEFGMPEKEPGLLWAVLANLAAQEFAPERIGSAPSNSPDPARWVPIIAKMADVLASGSAQEKQAIVEILALPRLVDETLPNEFFETALFLPDSAVQRVCANTLSRRRQWDRLAELGWKLQSEGQLIAFVALACPPSGDEYGNKTRSPDYSGEDKFWSHCMKTQTLRAASELITRSNSNAGQFNRTVHDPLRDFLLEEAGKSDQRAEDFSEGNEGFMMSRAVDFLAEWGLEEDRDVFKRLLKYRGYEKQEGSRGEPLRPFVAHRYQVRDAARRALLKQGVAVPENIEMEKEMTGADAAQRPLPARR